MCQAQTLICECSLAFISPVGRQSLTFRACRLKWKPPSENSIDFKLQLRFPPSKTDLKHPDYYSKPVFVLHTWMGSEGGDGQYEPYDQLSVEDDEWEE
jgi:hypothetical protein